MNLFMSLIVGVYLVLATFTGEASAQTKTLQDLSAELAPLPSITIYSAKQIITLYPAKLTAQAVAVLGDRILAVGKVNELKSMAMTMVPVGVFVL